MAPCPGLYPRLFWIDTDAALGASFRDVDDILALLYAFASPELAPRGASVLFGNIADVDAGRRRLARMVERFGPSRLGIHPGARSASDLGVETAASEPLTVLMLGPATTVATVARRHPELVARIERVVAVAGRRPGEGFRPGKGRVALRDLNFECDPAGFRALLESRVPLTLVPFAAGNKLWITVSDVDALRKRGAAGAWFAAQSGTWLDLWVHALEVTGFNPFDSVAAAHLTSPELFRCERASPAVIREGPDDGFLGRLLGRRKPYLLVSAELDSPFRVDYCADVDPTVKQAIVERLTALA